MTSWEGFGNQIGAILGVIETYVLDQHVSEEFLMTWGWRISFWSGGIIGLLGIYLRSKLEETPVFKKLKEQHHLDKESVLEVINHYKRRIILGTGYGVINAVTFYMIATYIPTYFDEKVGLSPQENAFVSLSILILTTIGLPFFGMLGDRFNNKKILISCAILIIILLFPLYYSIINKELLMLAIVGGLYILPITCITALIAFQYAYLYPTAVRFTGIGLSFNLADGIVGGFTPAISLLLLQYTQNDAAFCWFILVCALVSLYSYFKIKQ